MSSYKRLILLNILKDIYPGIPIACGTTYGSIILHNTHQHLVPEKTIINSYPAYVQKYNLFLLRQLRAQKLSATDKYGLADYPFSDDATKQAWLTYRQALRSITDAYPNPDADNKDNLLGVVWPVSPLTLLSTTININSGATGNNS